MGERRLRIGLMVPSSNTVMEVDFHRSLPPNYTVHTARMYMEETTRQAEEVMVEKYAPEAASVLRTVNPDVAVFGCTSAGSLYGMDYDASICNRIKEITGVRTVSVLSSVAEALGATGAKRIAIITPYIEELNLSIVKSLEESGLTVAAIHGMGISVNFNIGMVTPEEIVAFAFERLRGVESQAIFFSCTNMRAVEALPALKRSFQLPIVTSNQAVIDKVKEIGLELTG